MRPLATLVLALDANLASFQIPFGEIQIGSQGQAQRYECYVFHSTFSHEVFERYHAAAQSVRCVCMQIGNENVTALAELRLFYKKPARQTKKTQDSGGNAILLGCLRRLFCRAVASPLRQDATARSSSRYTRRGDNDAED